MPASRFECPRCQTMFMKDMGGEAAFVECPSCGALALPAGGDDSDEALARAMSGSHDGPPATTIDQSPVPTNSADGLSDPRGLSLSDPGAVPNTGDGIFSGLLAGGDPSGPSAAAPPPPSARADSGLDFDFGKDLDVDFGSLPQSKPAVHALPRALAAAAAASPPPSAGPAPVRSAPGAVMALPTDALDALQEQEDTDGSGRKAAPWGGLSDEAFGDLEKAFDEMALRPQPRGRGKGLSADESAFLKGESTDPGAMADGPTSRRAAPPRPPPRRSTKPTRARPPHLTLSDEAKRLAFLPLRLEQPKKVFDESLDRRAQKPDTRAEPRLERRLEVAADKAVSAETTDLVREKKAARVVPSATQGLTFLRVAALILVAAIAGAAGGFFLTPKPQRPNTPRARAELKLAEGNKFYTEGRFDDALGVYREASRTDPTYAVAHRAVGAALAKLQRFDDAAEAYAQYLDLEPSALDAADVKEAIARRKKPNP